MTIKDAILKALEEIGKPTNSNEVTKFIKTNNESILNTKTPENTVSAQLGDFIRNQDTRVGRIKQSNGTYLYYLTKNENEINNEIEEVIAKPAKNSYKESDLHALLTTYLRSIFIYSKTIFHESSKNSKDANLIWTHPDMVGIKLLNLQTKECQNLLKGVNTLETLNSTHMS